MKRVLLFCSIIVAFATHGFAAERPNVVLIMADDLGFSDVGCYGGEIRTPNLDLLAANGIRFTQFYNTGRCWPTRGSLLTGYYAQQIRRDTVPGVQSGGRGVRPEWASLLPRALAAAGYRSYHCGKWHIDGMPIENGFDRSYYLKDQGRFFNPKVHWEDDSKLPPIEPGGDYYGTTAIADHAVEYLHQHKSEHAENPFFLYLAFTAPHFPLHALPEDIARYENRYDVGWNVIREKRYSRLKEAGMVSAPLSKTEPDVGPPYHFPEALKTLGAGEVNRPIPWDDLTDQQKRFQASKMALHAAMIDRVDQEIGKVLKQIRSMGAWDNTLILFLSDNGGSAEIMVRDDGHDPKAAPGSAATYLCIGPGWSNAANTPFRRHKTWVHEGGISTPLIVQWPAGIKSQGELRTTPGHVIDIYPTLLEVCGAKAPAVDGAASRPGKSLLGVFKNDAPVDRESLWWLHEGNRGLRKGDMKIVAAKDEPWSLYNLANDRTEQNDLANSNPDELKAMIAQWESLHKQFVQQTQASTR